MWGLPLLLASLLVVTATADKAEVQQWTEVLRKAANSFVTQNRFDIESLQAVGSKIPINAVYRWVHKDEDSGLTYACGGTGGVETLTWIIQYMYAHHRMREITPGQAAGDDIAVWNIRTDKDTRKCRIQGQFDRGNLVSYMIFYDQESPLV